MLISVFGLMLLAGCSSDKLLVVASMRGAICDGESNCLFPCYLVKETGDAQWSYMALDKLQGFPYEWGHEYVIKISKDGEYEGIESKTKKTSEGVDPLDIYDESWGYNTPCEQRYERQR